MKRNRIKLLFILIPLIVTLSGCVNVNRQFKSIRYEIFKNIDGAYTKEVELGFGKGMMVFAGMIVGLSDMPYETRQIIRQVDRVQVGVYKKAIGEKYTINNKLLQDVSSMVKEKGWSYVVKSKESDGVTGVYLRDGITNRIKDMLVFHIDQEQLVIVTISGDMEDIFQLAMQAKNKGFFEKKHHKPMKHKKIEKVEKDTKTTKS